MARVSTGAGSFQAYGTPLPLFEAINEHFPCTLDLAANAENAKCVGWYGPGGLSENSLRVQWQDIPQVPGEWWYLNPPYADIEPWYRKCAIAAGFGKRIVSLVPMDNADWCTNHIPGNAGIWHLKGRVKFDGAEQSGAKDSVLHIWDKRYVGSYRIWDWRRDLFIL